MKVQIEESWKKLLGEEFDKPYFTDLAAFVRHEYLVKTVYPKPQNVFRAFNACPVKSVAVVIIGQDPYHGNYQGKPQANGLCFSVDDGIPIPPSLQNIYKEIHAELGVDIPTTGNLEHWAEQGVLMLNATLTVRAGEAGSHQGKGWEKFTDAVIRELSNTKEGLIFILWGNYAKQKGAEIDRSKHTVLESPHPSPFSAHNGFFGNGHFKQTNAILQKQGKAEIQWTTS